MSATRKFYKYATGTTDKGPRPKRKIVAIENGEVVLDCGHRRPASGKERVGGERRCEVCPERKAHYMKSGGQGWACDRGTSR